MKVKINSNVNRVIILDISSIYAQIYDQGYFCADDISNIKKQYSDTEHWRIVIL